MTPMVDKQTSAPAARGEGRRSPGGRGVGAALLGAATLAGVFWAFHEANGGGRFLYVEWMTAGLWLLPVWLLAGQRQHDGIPADTAQRGYGPLCVPFAFMALYLVCGAARDPWFFLMDWTRRCAGEGPGLSCTLDATVTVTALVWAVLILRPRWANTRVLVVLLLLAQAIVMAKLFMSTRGAPLYRDDHPSFMYRLWQFGAVAPRILTYDPHWNGGVTGAILAETGVNSMGMLWWPLWRWLPTTAIYTPLFGATFILFVPWLAAASVRVAGLPRSAAACAAILSLGFSSESFLWMLHFGTVGSALSGAFVIPLTAGLYRAFVLDRTDARTAAWIVASGFMLVQWPPGLLMGAAVGAGVLALPRAWTWRKVAFLTFCAVAILALHWRGLLDLLTTCRDNIAYTLTTAPASHPSPGNIARGLPERHRFVAGLIGLLRQANRVHPLVLFGGIAGLGALTDRRLARWMVPPLVLLALLAGWSGFVLPKLQMGRMVVPLFRMALLPAAVLAGEVLDATADRRPRSRVWPALILALLAIGAWNSGRIFGNGGHAKYVIPEAPGRTLVDVIQRESPPGTRALFAGRTVHGYGGGHVAALPLMTGREMMACDYYAFPPDTVEYEYPPRPFRETSEGMREFFTLYNVGCIVTYHAKWADYFAAHPELAVPITIIKSGNTPFHVFRVPAPPGLFAQGTGRVQAGFNRLDVELDTPEAEAVIRYNWCDRLRADGAAELFPFDAGRGVRLIGIRPNGQKAVRIRMSGYL